jgi:protease-4
MMPPPPMPPMMMPPGPWGPPPPRRSGVRTFFTVILVLGLVCSLFLNLALMGSSASSRGAQQTVLQAGDSTQVIAVIPVSGMIQDQSADRFVKYFDQIDKDSNVKAVVIAVDTPGGSVSASDVMYHRIERYKTDHSQTPVVVSMGGLATSGGYYLSAQADYIIAEPTTLTGNIGVLLPMYNASDLASKWGIKETTITAPPNGYKNAGSPLAPVTEADKAYLQGLVDVAYKRFVKIVKDGRTGKLTKPVEQIADGRVYTADDAKTVGLVDQIGYPDDAYAYAAKKAGLTKPQVVKYHENPSLLDLLSGSSTVAPAKAQSGNVVVNGVNVNLDVAAMLREMSSGRMMYLWQGQ